MFTNSINRLFAPVIKYIYKQLMSREAARTTTKSKMEVSATSLNRLIFFTESPTPDSTGVLDTLRYFFKNMLKLL